MRAGDQVVAQFTTPMARFAPGGPAVEVDLVHNGQPAGTVLLRSAGPPPAPVTPAPTPITPAPAVYPAPMTGPKGPTIPTNIPTGIPSIPVARRQ